LRSAIIAANHNAGGDLITLLAGTYVLSIPGNVTTTPGSGEGYTGNPLIGDLDVKDSGTTITGAGLDVTIISQTTPAAGVPSYDRVFEINPDLLNDFHFTITDLTITGGNTPDGGGGIIGGSPNNYLEVDRVRFTQNQAFGNGSGGGAVLFIGGG